MSNNISFSRLVSCFSAGINADIKTSPVLVANSKCETIPAEFDFYEKLIGSWDAIWVDNENMENERKVNGVFISFSNSSRVRYLCLGSGRSAKYPANGYLVSIPSASAIPMTVLRRVVINRVSH